MNNYNYHTHTYRCGHAGDFSDEEYVKDAKKAGIKILGFSDHVPIIDLEYQDPNVRMHITEVNEYLDSINELKRKNPDMLILSGFEAEYNPAQIELLCLLRDKVDYLVLGQHFLNDGITKVQRENNPNYPLEYAKSVCEALDTGLFDMVAHPDIFMSQLRTVDDKELFLKNSVIASRMICKKAKELDIPLELNLYGVIKGEGYPDPTFWSIACEEGVKVVVGADAHNPNQLLTMKEDLNNALDLINNLHLNYVEIDYNPVKSRNKELDLLVEKTKKNAISYEEYITNQVINKIKSSDDVEKTSIDFIQYLNDRIKSEDPISRMESIRNDDSLDPIKKKNKLKHMQSRVSVPLYKDTLMKRRYFLNVLTSRINEEFSIDNTKKH